jgi:hypothetical protein
MLFLNSSNIFPELQFFEVLLPPGVGLVLYLSPFLFIAILLCRCFADRFSVVLIQFNNGWYSSGYYGKRNYGVAQPLSPTT